MRYRLVFFICYPINVWHTLDWSITKLMCELKTQTYFRRIIVHLACHNRAWPKNLKFQKVNLKLKFWLEDYCAFVLPYSGLKQNKNENWNIKDMVWFAPFLAPILINLKMHGFSCLSSGEMR